MRRAVCVLLAVLLLCVPAWAVTLDPSVLYDSVEDGRTVSNIGVFKHKNVALPQLYRDQLTEFFTFPIHRCIVTYAAELNKILFIYFPSGAPSRLRMVRRNGCFYLSSQDGLSCTVFSWSYPDLNLVSVEGCSLGTSEYKIGALIYCNAVIYDDGTGMGDDSDCSVDRQPVLYFHDDLGDDTGAVEEENKGVLDWLDGFWDSFLGAVKGLFVPEDGYFQSWAEEVQGAFAEKTGGLSQAADQLQGLFAGIGDGEGKGPSLVITYPAGFFGSGTGAATGDLLGLPDLLSFIRGLLNAILAVFTILHCGRKLLDMVQQ